MPDFYIQTGAARPSITDTLTSAGEPVDLTGATVTFNLYKHGKSFFANSAASIIDATAGTVQFDFTGLKSLVLTEAGMHQGRWRVSFPDGSGNQFFPSNRHLDIMVDTL